MKISIKQLKHGQPRPYADSEYLWEIKFVGGEVHSGHIDILKRFCTQILHPCGQHKSNWKTYQEDPKSYFAGYWEFVDKGNDTFEYQVFYPYAD